MEHELVDAHLQTVTMINGLLSIETIPNLLKHAYNYLLFFLMAEIYVNNIKLSMGKNPWLTA